MRRAHKFLEAFLIGLAENFSISWQKQNSTKDHTK